MSNSDELGRLAARHDRIVQVAANIPFTELPRIAGAIVAEMKRRAPILPAATAERQPGELRDSIVATPGSVEVTSGFEFDGETGRTTDLVAVAPQVAENANRAPDAVLITAGNDQVPYAAYVEFGTSKRPAEPFFYPTIRLMAQRSKQTLVGAWRSAIDDAWTKD